MDDGLGIAWVINMWWGALKRWHTSITTVCRIFKSNTRAIHCRCIHKQYTQQRSTGYGLSYLQSIHGARMPWRYGSPSCWIWLLFRFVQTRPKWISHNASRNDRNESLICFIFIYNISVCNFDAIVRDTCIAATLQYIGRCMGWKITHEFWGYS